MMTNVFIQKGKVTRKKKAGNSRASGELIVS
jgi:hypothetical protein